ncbi:MAG: hypothetical protein BV457_01585 [Thermoplasmata archaeon M9B1D]|nr:MAG: hypothetical protein BV457_01585 [Thermoplasmata archaeon M9B1D]
MGNILPKAKMYVFLSLICLIINISVCLVAMATQNIDYNNYLESEEYKYTGEMPDTGTNVSIGNFVLGTTSSFLPFFSIVPLAILGLDFTVSVFIGVIFGIIGALQLFLIIVIALNLAPKVLGSGFDV